MKVSRDITGYTGTDVSRPLPTSRAPKSWNDLRMRTKTKFMTTLCSIYTIKQVVNNNLHVFTGQVWLAVKRPSED